MITLSPDSRPLIGGSTIEVCVTGPPNTTKTVTIDNGDPSSSEIVDLEIQIDSSGEGCVTWVVWSELYAKFNAPGCPEEARQVALPAY